MVVVATWTGLNHVLASFWGGRGGAASASAIRRPSSSRLLEETEWEEADVKITLYVCVKIVSPGTLFTYYIVSYMLLTL